MTTNKVQEAQIKARVINEETQSVLSKVQKKNNKAVGWFVISWTVLLIIGLSGIYRQNQIATENKRHIDCVVKLFTKPLPPGARARIITDPNTTCNINFTQ